MRNFQDTFETHKRSFISVFSICMTVPLNIVPFVLIINDKPVIACYLLRYSISFLFHIFSLFHLLKVAPNINLNAIKSASQ